MANRVLKNKLIASIEPVVSIQHKASAYSKFSFGVSGQGKILPTSAFSGRFLDTPVGGDGSDGKLVVSTGTTTIDLGSERVVVKQYTDIAITGDADVVFTNPNTNGTFILFLSQKNITLTSSATPMIDCSSLGAANNTGVTSTTTANGTDGNDGYGVITFTNKGNASTTSAVGTGGATTYSANVDVFNFPILQKYPQAFVGASGGGGSISCANNANSITSSTGGRGGGCLIMECAEKWTFTTANGVSVAGGDGIAGGDDPGNAKAYGGAGGGAAGYFNAYVGFIGANTGTINVSGGTGGNSNIEIGCSGSTTYGAGGGGNPINAGSDGTTTTTHGAKTGGDGGDGFSNVERYRF